MSSRLPTTKEPLVDQRSGISTPWYRWLARIERLLGGISTVTGTGLTETPSGALTIAENGVSNTMLRDSLALSVIGNPLNAEGDPQDIAATANGRFLQRDGDLLVFRYPRLPVFTVGAVPLASDQDEGTMIFVSDEIGGPTIAFSDGTNWLRTSDNAVIS